MKVQKKYQMNIKKKINFYQNTNLMINVKNASVTKKFMIKLIIKIK